MTLQQLESELKKLSQMPPWGKKQSDDWDKESNFVYQFPDYETLQMKLKQLNKGDDFDHYVLHRWYNFLSAKGAEKIFCDCPGVSPQINQKDKLVDFTIQGISFDLKTTIFPKGYPESLHFAQKNPQHLIEWLYAQQSTEQRFHLENRLFILLLAEGDEHWKLRAELSKMQQLIQNYVLHFDKKNLYQIHFEGGKTALSDILWFRG